MNKKTNGYVAGIGCGFGFVILLFLAINNAWNTTGQLLWGFTAVFGGLSVGCFFKPETFGAAVSKYFEQLSETKGTSDSHDKQIQKKSSGIQVMSHDQSSVKIFLNQPDKEHFKNSKTTEGEIARQVVSYLEDRRVLYLSSEMECPNHCVQSVLQIREFLTTKIGELPGKTDLSTSLKAMRAACRKFLSAIGDPDGDIIRFGSHQGHWASWEFNGAIGELRGVFGIHLEKIVNTYNIQVEKDLASIMPLDDKD
ncbi:MAG: DUF6650 family protein [Candidatus Bathyarchaeia archaeon]|jgi:hypothetical protein